MSACLIFRASAGVLFRCTHVAPFCRRELGKRGVKSLLAVPISFVSEHIETLEEIDMEYRELAEESGEEAPEFWGKGCGVKRDGRGEGRSGWWLGASGEATESGGFGGAVGERGAAGMRPWGWRDRREQVCQVKGGGAQEERAVEVKTAVLVMLGLQGAWAHGAGGVWLWMGTADGHGLLLMCGRGPRCVSQPGPIPLGLPACLGLLAATHPFITTTAQTHQHRCPELL
mgnify:CR=1 FL=1